MDDPYAVVGNPIIQSKSPVIHAAFARQTRQAMSYEALLAPLDGFVATVESFRKRGGKGLNVTAPFKVEAFALAAITSTRALQAGAVNTLSWKNGSWLGDNTDGIGLVADLEKNLRYPLAGKDIILFGAGGAARGVIGPILAAGPRSLVVGNRTFSKAQELVRAFVDEGPIAAVALDEFEDRVVDLIIDATSASLGSAAEPFPWPAVQVRPGALAYEMSYGRRVSEFSLWARNCGVQTYIDGLGMLVEQAAASFFIWRNLLPDTAPVLKSLRAQISA